MKKVLHGVVDVAKDGNQFYFIKMGFSVLMADAIYWKKCKTTEFSSCVPYSETFEILSF